MTDLPLHSSEFVQLSDKYRVRFSLRRTGIECQWAPQVPGKKLMPALYPAYSAALRGFLASCNDALGGPAFVISPADGGDNA